MNIFSETIKIVRLLILTFVLLSVTSSCHHASFCSRKTESLIAKGKNEEKQNCELKIATLELQHKKQLEETYSKGKDLGFSKGYRDKHEEFVKSYDRWYKYPNIAIELMADSTNQEPSSMQKLFQRFNEKAKESVIEDFVNNNAEYKKAIDRAFREGVDSVSKLKIFPLHIRQGQLIPTKLLDINHKIDYQSLSHIISYDETFSSPELKRRVSDMIWQLIEEVLLDFDFDSNTIKYCKDDYYEKWAHLHAENICNRTASVYHTLQQSHSQKKYPLEMSVQVKTTAFCDAYSFGLCESVGYFVKLATCNSESTSIYGVDMLGRNSDIIATAYVAKMRAHLLSFANYHDLNREIPTLETQFRTNSLKTYHVGVHKYKQDKKQVSEFHQTFSLKYDDVTYTPNFIYEQFLDADKIKLELGRDTQVVVVKIPELLIAGNEITRYYTDVYASGELSKSLIKETFWKHIFSIFKRKKYSVSFSGTYIQDDLEKIQVSEMEKRRTLTSEEKENLVNFLKQNLNFVFYGNRYEVKVEFF